MYMATERFPRNTFTTNYKRVNQPRMVEQTILDEWRRMHEARLLVERQKKIDCATGHIATVAGVVAVFAMAAALYWALLGAI